MSDEPQVIPYDEEPAKQGIHILLIAALDRLGGELTVTRDEYLSILSTTGYVGALRVSRDEAGTLTGRLTRKVEVLDGSRRSGVN